MKKDIQIGIIGARGVVGQTVAQYLAQRYRVLKGGRTIPRIEETWQQVDIYQVDSLIAFCNRCEVVINSAGPTYQMEDRIAKVAAICGTKYVDVFGGGKLERLLTPIKGQNIIGAGCVPGLSGILLRYLAEQMAPEDSLKIFHGGEECGGLAACKDILLSLVEKYGIPDKILKDYQLCDAKSKGFIYEHMNGFQAPVCLSAFFTEEDWKVKECFELANLEDYQVYANTESKDLIAKGCVQFTFAANDDTRNGICRDIMTKQQELLQGKSSWFGMRATAQGELGAREIIVATKDSSVITGLVAGLCAEFLLEEGEWIGTKWAFECLDAQRVFYVLEKYIAELKLVTKNIVSDMEFGEI